MSKHSMGAGSVQFVEKLFDDLLPEWRRFGEKIADQVLGPDA